jgi:hypothetical protein
MQIFLAVLFLLFFSSPVRSGEFDWKFEKHYQDGMLYLHPFVNYPYNLSWEYDWEQRQFSNHGFRLTVGSVTTDELLVDGELVINQDLGSGWRFRGRGVSREALHFNTGVESIFMGVEKTFYKNFSIFLLVNPSFDKEETDASTGILLTNSNREKYLRLAFIPEDFVYDEKNDRGGVSSQTPYAFEWFLRYGKEKWWIYSTGRFSTGFKREYPDKEASPELNSHQQQINNFTAKVYYLPTKISIIGFSLSYYHFDEAREFTEPQNIYTYANNLYDISLELIVPWKERNRFRLLSHYMIQNAKSREFNAHDFNRDDFLSGFFLERIFSRHIIDAAYLFSIFDWTYTGLAGQDNYSRNGYTDKLELGWTYSFAKSARIHISISHQVSIGGFGGANLQYIMFF